jgi:hypothetical protein
VKSNVPCFIALLVALPLFSWACAGPAAPQPAPQTHARSRGDNYYLSTCARCDRLLGSVGTAIDVIHEQRSLRFCSDACAQAFHREPAATLAHADQVVTADQLPRYPIATSIVSGRRLGPNPVDLVWCNRLVRLADARERDDFLRDPERHLRALDSRVLEAQAAGYGMPDRCPVQGDILDSDTPVDFVIANRMVRVCCGRCMSIVKARPYQFLALVDYANKEAAEKARSDP